jgi:predicted regulator of Ras-like GTPase activity (Roadblock/LC7/MglB family)
MTMAIDAAKLSAVLQDFVSSTSDVQGAALVTPDGLSLSSVLPSSMDEERVAAMSAAMLSLGERIGSELVRGSIQQIYVDGDKGYGVLTGCGDDAVLLVLANHTAKQGLLMLEIRRAIAELKPFFS